jgi:hypothetical protein
LKATTTSKIIHNGELVEVETGRLEPLTLAEIEAIVAREIIYRREVVEAEPTVKDLLFRVETSTAEDRNAIIKEWNRKLDENEGEGGPKRPWKTLPALCEGYRSPHAVALCGWPILLRQPKRGDDGADESDCFCSNECRVRLNGRVSSATRRQKLKESP